MKGPTLFLITARKGSLGLPNKNFRNFGNNPLIELSYDFAKNVSEKNDIICVSTNDDDIINYFKQKKVNIHFKRPEKISLSNSTSEEVILHAINYFSSLGKTFEYVMLLQPTSPFREIEDYYKILNKMDEKTDMVVSVKKTKDSPFFNQYIENGENQIEPLNNFSRVKRRQDAPIVYALNGAYYFFRVDSFLKNKSLNFERVRKYEMPFWRSIDIDTQEDWDLAIYYSNKFCK